MRKGRRALPVCLALLAVCGVFFAAHAAARAAYPRDYAAMIEEQSERQGLDPMLLYAVVRCESSFRADAVSSIGARGLMQLTEETFDWVRWRLGEEEVTVYDDAFDPETNLRYGAYLLSYLLEKFGGEETALAAYHAGAGIVGRWLSEGEYSADGKTLDHIPYGDTAQYVPRVLRTKEIYTRLYGKE